VHTNEKAVERESVILFSDIRNFSLVSENMKPSEVVDLLNTWYESMNSAVAEHEGETNNLMGDTVLALFENSDSAMRAATAMQVKMVHVNKGDIYQGREIYHGTGLHLGPVISGRTGFTTGKKRAVIGDAINVASKIEALTRIYGVDIIVSEYILNRVKSEYNHRFLDTVLVKGSNRALDLYELFDHQDRKTRLAKQEYEPRYNKAFALYKNGEFSEAAEMYDSLLGQVKQDTTLLTFYRDRCLHFRKKKDGGMLPVWNGTYIFY
jgi:class 3 adenylate cyclase